MPGIDTRMLDGTHDTPLFRGNSLEMLCSLEIRLFGPMEVHLCGVPIPRLRTRKGLWLLALLALRGGRSVERDWVAGTLWPDSNESNARRSLRQSLHDLRVALGHQAQRLGAEDRRSLRLDLAGAAVDVLEFDAAIGRGDLASLEAAVRLYRGPLLEDCAEEWGLEERRRREQEFVTTLERLATAAAARKEYAAAAGYLRPIVDLDPYREDSQRALMHVLAGGGNPAGALLVYRQFRELLRREMATEPAEETTALFRKLRDERQESSASRVPTAPTISRTNSPALLSMAPNSLPLALTPLVGRDDAAREVVTRLAHAPLVTLTGTGGIGKTRLAVAVAEELAEEYPDGARFVPLASLTDPTIIPHAVQIALGIDSPQPGIETLKQYLASRRLLLVLDNCEHLLDACAALADALLGHCPGLRILATSRQPLGLTGETVWRVPSLALPPAAAEWPGGLTPSDYAAVRLFVERAQAAEAGFALTSHNAGAVAAICRRLDGIPLALELAAARVRSLSVGEISTRLGNGFGLLTGGGRTLLPRQQTLAATFDWSWDLLSDAERGLVECLSVFVGGWSLEAAESVCPDGASLGPGDVVDLLTALVDKSLVVYRPGDGRASARYSLLETVRQYSGERLRNTGGEEAARDRHRDFFLAWTEEIDPKLWREEQNHWFNILEIEHDNLRAALDWCRSQNDAEQGIRMVAVLGRFWNTHGHMQEGRTRLDIALSLTTPQTPPLPCIKALLHAGWTALTPSDPSDYVAARRYFEQALSLIREHGDRKMLPQPLNYLAALANEEEDYQSAEALYNEALALSREFDLKGQLAAVLNNLGALAVRRVDYKTARGYLEESITRSVIAGTPQMHGLALYNLSIVNSQQGLYEQGETHCRESLRLFYECGATINIPEAFEQMALLTHSQGQSGRAAVLLGAAASLWEVAGTIRKRTQRHMDLFVEAEATLGSEAYADAFAIGRKMDLEQAVNYALA